MEKALLEEIPKSLSYFLRHKWSLSLICIEAMIESRHRTEVIPPPPPQVLGVKESVVLKGLGHGYQSAVNVLSTSSFTFGVRLAGYGLFCCLYEGDTEWAEKMV